MLGFRSLSKLLILSTFVFETQAFSLSASWVDFEFRSDGRYRVKVIYTVPELKEVREVWVDFSEKAKAEAYYFDLAKGADFYLPDSNDRSFARKVKDSPTPG